MEPAITADPTTKIKVIGFCIKNMMYAITSRLSC